MGRESGDRRRFREERSRRAVAAVVALAREHGLRVEEPAELNDLFSLMVHLRPAPVVARVATCMTKLRTPIADWLGLEIAVTAFLSEQGAPVVAPSRELPPGPHEYDGFEISFWTYLQPEPDSNRRRLFGYASRPARRPAIVSGRAAGARGKRLPASVGVTR